VFAGIFHCAMVKAKGYGVQPLKKTAGQIPLSNTKLSKGLLDEPALLYFYRVRLLQAIECRVSSIVPQRPGYRVYPSIQSFLHPSHFWKKIPVGVIRPFTEGLSCNDLAERDCLLAHLNAIEIDLILPYALKERRDVVWRVLVPVKRLEFQYRLFPATKRDLRINDVVLFR